MDEKVTLLVADKLSAVGLTKPALQRIGTCKRIVVARNGRDARAMVVNRRHPDPDLR